MGEIALGFDVPRVARFFKALGDETRLRIVALLAHRELCVCHLESALAASQPTISRHLALLRYAGLVESRRRGSWVYYRLAKQEDPYRERLLRGIGRGLTARRGVVRREIERLLRARGPEACR